MNWVDLMLVEDDWLMEFEMAMNIFLHPRSRVRYSNKREKNQENNVNTRTKRGTYI
jgi:hypothetical protein